MSDSGVDPLLERIDRDLEECDARSLPPLMSGPAAVVLDFAGRAGLELAPWQERFVMSAYEQDEHGGWRLRSDRELYDEVTWARPPYRGMRMADWPPAIWPAPEPRRPWWRRWWSR